MDGPAGSQGQSPPGSRGMRPTIGMLMLLIVGVGVGLAVMNAEDADPDRLEDWVLLYGGAVLGGVSLIGVPLLLRRRWRRPRRRFGSGELFWFAQGTSAWLLWPPIVVGQLSEARGRKPPIDPAAPQICFLYGTPLMAVYVAAALLAGGWLRPRRHRGRRAATPWQDRFGMLVGLSWAVLGAIVLSMIYRDRFR